jgi:signal transduction histidine kinase
VRAESAGPHVRLSVIDTGPGIPEHVLPRIFEPLFTTKSFGVGLGLPTVRQIVEQLGGSLHVESVANAGTTFTVFLPRHGETAAHAADPTARGAAA